MLDERNHLSELMGSAVRQRQQQPPQPQDSRSDTAIGCIAVVVILGILIAISWAACSACGGGGDSGGSGQGYTLSDYQMINVGMSRSEVKSILGGNGEPVPGYPEQRIYINDDDCSNIVVVYLGDVVVDKAQAGL